MKKSFKLLLLTFMILYGAMACLKIDQANGQCTQCNQNEVLFNGYCFQEVANQRRNLQTQDQKIPPPPPKVPQNGSNNTGEFTVLDPKKYNGQPFLTAKTQILKLYPKFNISLVSKVELQAVAGLNVLTTFKLVKNSSDQYKVLVYIPLPNSKQKPSVKYVKLNGVVIKGKEESIPSGNTTTNSTDKRMPPPPKNETSGSNSTNNTMPPPPPSPKNQTTGTNSTNNTMSPPPPPPKNQTTGTNSTNNTMPPPPPPKNETSTSGSNTTSGNMPPPPPPQNGTTNSSSNSSNMPPPPPPQNGTTTTSSKTNMPPPPPPQNRTTTSTTLSNSITPPN